jgi:hypothetical protein
MQDSQSSFQIIDMHVALHDDINESTCQGFEDSILLSSTLKKRRAKMNKHKLKKRMKKMRKNTKISRS